MNKKPSVALILVTSLFFLWALTSNLIPTLIPHLKKACRLTDFQSAFVDSAYWIAYFIIAVPAGLAMKKFGYKKTIIAGLLIAAAGSFLFYPAAEGRSFGLFLTALFVVAGGMTFLETTANPYMTVLGPSETAAQRLNFAQAFNGLGAFIAAFFLSKVILSGKEISDAALAAMPPAQAAQLLTEEAKSVQLPYVVIGVLLLLVAVVFMLVKFPPETTADGNAAGKRNKLNILAHKPLMLGIAAQFFYVGAQVCISSFFIRYTNFAAGMQELEAANYLGLLLLGFMLGRYAGTFLMRFVRPEILLAIYSVANILLSAVVVFVGGTVSIYALIGIEFFMSIMYPTIFSLAIRGLGSNTKIASSYLVMAIVGGAVFPVLMGWVSDAFNIQLAYLVPGLCFFVVLFFSRNIKDAPVPARAALSVA